MPAITTLGKNRSWGTDIVPQRPIRTAVKAARTSIRQSDQLSREPDCAFAHFRFLAKHLQSCGVAPCIAHDGEQTGPTGSIDTVARVLIVGASRGIGLETVKAALEAGHSVHALARSARRIPVDHPKLEKWPGMRSRWRLANRQDIVAQDQGILASDAEFSMFATNVILTVRLLAGSVISRP